MAGTSLVLRRFEPSDAEAVTALLHRAYGELLARGLNFTAATQDAEVTARRAARGASWVLADGTGPVATLTLSSPPSASLRRLTAEAAVPGRAWLNQLAVHPEHQGRGLARRLRDVALAHAAAAGHTSVGVDTAEPAEALQALYRRWGFVPRDVVRWPGKTYRSVVLARALPAGPASATTGTTAAT
jgi:GNAT superfamily N-acetyltransferase